MARKARAGRSGAQSHRRPAARKKVASRQAKPATRKRTSARPAKRPGSRKNTPTARLHPKRGATRPASRARAPRKAKGQVSALRPAPPVSQSLPPTAVRSHRPKSRPRIAPGLLRERRILQEDESRYLGAALTGQEELVEKLLEHTSTGPALTGGDLDGNWELAYSSGDEAPGGDNPTPDQADVDDFGRALGIHYADDEELKLGEKEVERDRHRWELDPASAEDYRVREEE